MRKSVVFRRLSASVALRGRLKACIVAVGIGLAVPFVHADYGARDDVRTFVDEMVAGHAFDRRWLERAFSSAEYKQSIVDAMTRPAEKVLKWDEYQDIFLNDQRIRGGRTFLRDNARLLAEAEQRFGVPPEIVTAILGVETYYGERMGGYRVIDALATLAFDYPARAGFFRSELEQFLLLVREERHELDQLVGSYAGAMGYGQFIPSSFRAYAVDFDGDGRRDIWTNRADAIGSVANYLAEHGWRRGEPVIRQVDEVGAAASRFVKRTRADVALGELAAAGLVVPPDWSSATQVAPLRYQGKAGVEYWLGQHNFYVITRYNHSDLYAMAVYQLSRRF